ncbi:MAG: shikimate kinase [Halieaceae bacterium]|jgi:shikimate kinase
MGVGKTTIGKKLARIMGLEFIDLDGLIEMETGLSISILVKEFGETYFRELESKLLLKLTKKQNVLVSTGGGAPCFFDNMTMMNENGTTVFLKMDEKSLVNRLKNKTGSRPLLEGKNELELLDFVKKHVQERLPFYEKAQIEFDVLNFNAARQQELKNKIELI